MSGRARVTPGGVGSSDGPNFGPDLATAFIGSIEAITGSATLTRLYDVAELKLGDPLCQGDVVETLADGQVSIRFIDGTVLSLSNDTCLVLKHFVDGGVAPSALFDVTRGAFAFVAGEVAKAGRLSIDTPIATVRGRTQTGGFGMLSMAALYFAILDEALANSPNAALFDDGVIDYKDLAHGVFDVVTKEAISRHFVVDDPGKSVILHRLGSSISADFVTNSPTQMAQLQAAQHDVLQTFSLGLQQGPTNAGPSGSSTPPGLFPPPFMQPINYTPPVITPLPSGPTNGGLADSGPPKPPPVIFVPPLVNSTIVLGPDTVNAAPTGSGWIFNPDNGHYYRFVSADGTAWNGALNGAAADGAYLATITTASENSFITSNLVQGIDWIGGTDAAQEGTWVWATGPEAGTVFYVNSPQSFPGYSNWDAGEPNNLNHTASGGLSQENYLQIFPNGLWNDEQGPNQPSSIHINGFIEEKGTPGVILANFVKNAPTLISTAALLANDTDANGFPLNVTAVAGTSAHGGTLTLNNGVITYTPATDYFGGDQFTYTVTDGHGGVATGFLSFTVSQGAVIPPGGPTIVLGADTVKAAPTSAGWVFDPDNGHYYRFVSADGTTWNDALNGAAADGAYLATITSASENSFITSHLVQGINWIGGTDAAQEGTWVWATGPEAGTVFYVNSPQSFPGYSNWSAGEPSNSSHAASGGLSQENYLQIFPNGLWNDEQGPNQPSFVHVDGFIEEKGGTPDVVLATFVKNGSTLISTAALLANDTDSSGFPLDVTAVAGTSTHGGTLTLNNGVITYTPSANYIGDDQFTYTVSDGHGGVATGFLSFTVLSDLSQVAADPSLGGVNASDTFTITPQQSDYLGTIATNLDNNGGVDWHFDASPAQLSQLAGLTQYYTVQDQTNPAANQTISVSVGSDGKDQFVFDMNTNGGGTHAMVSFSTASANGTYLGDVIELDNFTNAQNAPLQLADALTHLTQDSHGNAVVDLGHGDSISFQGVTAAAVQAEAAQIFAFHQHALV